MCIWACTCRDLCLCSRSWKYTASSHGWKTRWGLIHSWSKKDRKLLIYETFTIHSESTYTGTLLQCHSLICIVILLFIVIILLPWTDTMVCGIKKEAFFYWFFFKAFLCIYWGKTSNTTLTNHEGKTIRTISFSIWCDSGVSGTLLEKKS